LKVGRLLVAGSHMKYYLILSAALLVVVLPCASADKNADPYSHAQSHSHHSAEQTKKTHRAQPKLGSTSNENAQLAKLERQTAQIHSAPATKTPKPSIPVGKPQPKAGGGESMNFTNHQQKQHSTTASASGRVSKNGIPR
jgi:hypothetical protein